MYFLLKKEFNNMILFLYSLFLSFSYAQLKIINIRFVWYYKIQNYDKN